jgi:hypothetical protein
MAGARLPPRRVGPSRVGPGITHVQFREASADSLNKIVILGAPELADPWAVDFVHGRPSLETSLERRTRHRLVFPYGNLFHTASRTRSWQRLQCLRERTSLSSLLSEGSLREVEHVEIFLGGRDTGDIGNQIARLLADPSDSRCRLSHRN